MDFEEMKLEFLRKGDTEKVEYLNNLHKVILFSHVKRIQQNDKTVLKEVVLPKWVSWDLLYSWASKWKLAEGRRCILCNELQELGIDFKEKWICENCFIRLKNLE